MKKQAYITFVILLVIKIQAFGQVKFDPLAFINFGYENNIFQSPDILELNNGNVLNSTDLILSDRYLDLGYDIYLKQKILKKHTFRLNHDLWNRRYTNYSTLNQFRSGLKIGYSYKINRNMQAGVKLRFDRAEKIGTSVLGDELTQLFSYKRKKAELYYKHTVLKNTALDAGAIYSSKAYDRTLGVLPLDYTALGFYFGFGHKLKVNKLKLKISLDLTYSDKAFSDIIASDSSGRELASYPLRNWKYYSAELSVKGRFKGGFGFKPFVSYRIRDDVFEDYYSYQALDFGILLAYRSKTFSLEFVPKYQSLNYLVKMAPDPNRTDDPLLVYNTLIASFRLEYEVYKGVRLTLDAGDRNRETNTLDFSRKTRRSYNNYEVMVGVSVKPVTLLKKKNGKK